MCDRIAKRLVEKDLVHTVSGNGREAELVLGIVKSNVGGIVEIEWSGGLIQSFKHSEMICIYKAEKTAPE